MKSFLQVGWGCWQGRREWGREVFRPEELHAEMQEPETADRVACSQTQKWSEPGLQPAAQMPLHLPGFYTSWESPRGAGGSS